jgi:ATP-dependent helicase/nuclease subunit A
MNMIPIQGVTARRRASNPKVSAWVDASAGTGKTTVLTDRVLRLLLDGAAPERILCITFTRAAAAEMSIRVTDRLGRWAIASDAELEDALSDLTGERPSAAMRILARQLFARIVDAPSGFRIQTIHAFCQSVLRRFPLEAGIAPHFALLDDRTGAELLGEARQSLLIDAGRDADGPLGRALALLVEYMDERGFADLIHAVVASRRELGAAIAAQGGVGLLVPRMWRGLGLEPGQSPDLLLAEACHDATIDCSALRQACGVLGQGAPTDQAKAAAIAGWIDSADRASGWTHYVGQFLTGTGAPRKATTRAHKAIAHLLEPEVDRILAVLDRLRAAATAEATEAMLVVADALFARYEARKTARAMLDYDDLIETTCRLVEGDAAWVLYKLDGGIDHLLLDEAQDTNPEQWRIVRALATEFFAGLGARDVNRTIFVVGDGKQSIYSFQGADPSALSHLKQHFEAQLQALDQQLHPVELTKSYRSTKPVLDLVDSVFADPLAADGLPIDADMPLKHDLARIGHAGVVELWPVLAPDAADADTDQWPLPERGAPVRDPENDLAEKVADTIRGWIDRREILNPDRGPVTAGDVMILVRRRTRFVAPLVRALKARDVPVAGIDRLALTEPLAVRDLMALGRFLLLPEDDLTLAALLKSPLIGLDEDALFRLAHGRRGTLWSALLAASEEDAPAFEPARSWLADRLSEVDFARPFELYAGVLAAPCPGDADGSGRRALWQRLGPDALDPLDEFLSAALDYEQRHAPTLQGFIGWLEASEAEIKRELAGRTDAVRIVTVHGAKGLEAPIVFLPDTMQIPTGNHGPALLWHTAGGHRLPYWSPRADIRPELCASLSATANRMVQQEYRRLLYVALTRARDRLYVCGWHGKQTPAAGHWYGFVEAGMRALGAETVSAGDDSVLRLSCVASLGAAPFAAPAAEPEPDPLPAWARAAPAAEPRPFRPLAPSRIEMPGATLPALRSPVSGDDAKRFRRGRAMHRLLQILPDIPPAGRARAGDRILAAFPADERPPLIAEALAVVEAPALAQLFGPYSRAEVPIVGRIGVRGIAGQIDRLLVADGRVTIVDFKSGRIPSGGPSEVPSAYLAQMAAYRVVLRQIYPDHAIDLLLVWTDGPVAVTLDPAALDPFEAYLTSAPVNADADAAP